MPSRTVGLFLLSSVLHTHRHLGPRDRKQQLHGHTREIGMQSCSSASETCSSMDGQAFALFPLMGRSLSPQRHLWPEIRIDCAPTRSGTREFTASKPGPRPSLIFISAFGSDGKYHHVQLPERERCRCLERQVSSPTRSTRRHVPLDSHGECDLPPLGYHATTFMLIPYLQLPVFFRC